MFKDGMNLYQAFGGNPVNRVDPFGEEMGLPNVHTIPGGGGEGKDRGFNQMDAMLEVHGGKSQSRPSPEAEAVRDAFCDAGKVIAIGIFAFALLPEGIAGVTFAGLTLLMLPGDRSIPDPPEPKNFTPEQRRYRYAYRETTNALNGMGFFLAFAHMFRLEPAPVTPLGKALGRNLSAKGEWGFTKLLRQSQLEKSEQHQMWKAALEEVLQGAKPESYVDIWRKCGNYEYETFGLAKKYEYMPEGFKLTKDMLSGSRRIASKSDIHEIDRLIKQYSGKVKQWVKKSSRRMIDSNGRPFEYHWYEKAGQKFEIKKKFLDI